MNYEKNNSDFVAFDFSPCLSCSGGHFFGEVQHGYQFVEKGGSGYGVYVPESFDPSRRSGLIFAFGRTQNDMMLTRERLKEYADLWVSEAEKRGYVVIVPYWEPVVVESGHHTEKYFLEILEEAKLMYNINPREILLVGYGLGTVQAFMMAAFYSDQFSAIATIAGSPVRERITGALMADRLVRGLPPGRLPPVLLVYGENGSIPPAWLEEDKAFLEAKRNKVELKAIPQMGNEQHPAASAVILDWFN